MFSQDHKAPTGWRGKCVYSSRTKNAEPPSPHVTARRTANRLAITQIFHEKDVFVSQ